MKAAKGVIVAGVILAIVGAITWWRATVAREYNRSVSAFKEAYGLSPDDVSSAVVWFGAGLLAFGALVTLTGVALAVNKAR